MGGCQQDCAVFSLKHLQEVQTKVCEHMLCVVSGARIGGNLCAGVSKSKAVVHVVAFEWLLQGVGCSCRMINRNNDQHQPTTHPASHTHPVYVVSWRRRICIWLVKNCLPGRLDISTCLSHAQEWIDRCGCVCVGRAALWCCQGTRGVSAITPG